LCIAITFFAVTLLGDQRREQIIASRSGQYIVQILDKADSVAPPEIHQVIGPYIHQINQRLDPNFRPDPAQDLQHLQQMFQQQAQQAQEAGAAKLSAAAAEALKWQPPPTAKPQTPAGFISTGGDRR
jgi:hypothetical protein